MKGERFMLFVFGMMFSIVVILFLDFIAITLLFEQEIKIVKERLNRRKVGLNYEFK